MLWRLVSLLAALLVVAMAPLPAGAQPEPEPEPAPAPEPPAPEPPADDVKSKCLASFDASQRLRRAGELIAARDELVACAQQTCPSLVVVKCQQWLSEVKESIPTVVFSASRKGVDITDVQIYVDGELLLYALTGGASELDKGERKIRAVRGKAERHLSVLIREGEKNRVIEIDFTPKRVRPQPKPHRPKPVKPPEPSFEMPLMSWIGFGVGIVGVVVGSITGGIALSKGDTLEDECNAPPDGVTCKPAQKADFDGGLAAAHISTVSFAIGGAGIGLGVIGLIVFGVEGDVPPTRPAPARGVVISGTF